MKVWDVLVFLSLMCYVLPILDEMSSLLDGTVKEGSTNFMRKRTQQIKATYHVLWPFKQWKKDYRLLSYISSGEKNLSLKFSYYFLIRWCVF